MPREIEKKQFPTSMKGLITELGSLVLPSDHFELHWSKREQGHITGKRGCFSYRYRGGYDRGDGWRPTPAIIKGVWTTAVTTLKVEQVIHEGFYLKTSGRLIAFVINEDPTELDRPDFIFIIEDVGYVTKEEAGLTEDQGSKLRREAIAILTSTYTAKPSA